MARKGSNTNERWYRRYPKVYARTVAWQSRRGRRVKESTQYLLFRGLNTVSDDLIAQKTTSPYMINWRFGGDRRKIQSASLESRMGTKFLNDYGTVFTDIKPEDEEAVLELTICSQIKASHNSGNDLVVGGSVRLRNRNGATGALLIHYIQNEKKVCSAFIDLKKVGYNWANYPYRLIGGVKGKYETRFEIIDEFGDEYSNLVERPIEISATGKISGWKATTSIPVMGEALKEAKPDWQITSTTPLLGKMVNNNKFFGDLIEVVSKDVPYLIACIDDGVEKKIARLNLKTNDIDLIAGGTIASNARSFSGVLADGHIVYVDGVSPLKYIDVRDWTIKHANPELSPQHLAPAGFKYITLINNRIYLANLPDSPNYVSYSMIDRTGAKYYDFHDAFYSPNIATYDSRTTPITGIGQHSANSLLIFRENGTSIFSSPTGFEFGNAQQQDTFTNLIGVAEYTDQINYNGSVYFWNKSEGFRRFSGADATITSAHIDSLIRSIDPDAHRYVYAHNKKVHIQVDDYQLVFDLSNSQSASAWLMDTQRYVHRTYIEQKSDRLWATHSQYACFMELNTDTNSDFDCVIPCEYHTHYEHSPDSTGGSLFHKAMVHPAKMSNTTWYVGFDRNHEDNPSVWKKVVFAHEDQGEQETDIFYETEDSGSYMFTVGLKARAYTGQLRVKGYAYRTPIGISGMAMETQNIEGL